MGEELVRPLAPVRLIHADPPHAERTLRAAEEAASAVDPIRNLSGGSVAFGTFSSAHHLIGTDLVTKFRSLHPLVQLRVVGMNSVHVADQVRDGQLEAGLVALPVDDRGLEVSAVVWAAEAVYLSRDRSRTAPDARHLGSPAAGPQAPRRPAVLSLAPGQPAVVARLTDSDGSCVRQRVRIAGDASRVT